MLTFMLSVWFDADRAAEWDARNPGVFLQHLKTTVPEIKIQGSLFDRADKRCGMFAVVHSTDFAEIDLWIEQSPYQLAGIYTRTEVHRTVINSGTIG